MAIENEDKVNSEDDANVADEESAATEKEVEVAAEAEASEKKSNKLRALLMVLIVAIPGSSILAYIFMPDQLNSPFSDEAGADKQSSSDFDAVSPVTLYPIDGSGVRAQEPEWVAKQRTEMEKRHAELRKQNEEQMASRMNTSEVPQWVKDQQVQAEQRRQEFEKQNVASNQLAHEPPQWVKDQRAQMQKEQERYQQEWAKRSAAMASNRPPQPPWVTNQPGVNAYPPAQGYQNQMPVYGQNPAPYYNGAVPPANPYYYGNAPYSGPYNAPYGYPYR